MKTVLTIHHQIILVAAVLPLLAACDNFTTLRPFEQARHDITLTELNDIPHTQGVSDDELLEAMTSSSPGISGVDMDGQSAASEIPEPTGLPLDRAKSEFHLFTLPAHLPDHYDLNNAVVWMREVVGDAGKPEMQPDSVQIPGTNETYMTLRIAPAMKGLNIPVGAESSSSHVLVDGTDAQLIRGTWKIVVNKDKTGLAFRGWDPNGDVRLVFVRDGQLHEIMITPLGKEPPAVTTEQILRIANSWE